ncbi:hypothetical protein SPRG_13258 [Saprolegnia parasitica CBS 223.65]|uniref:Nucleotide-diphospho-sugar transferase domain-containing protein n=1 Tax=Saprolegnia parasitica (strain CBS 223.65) TaxID=695850 RepID=A0A067BUN8_SAPPC|nr:hypothetical protein SPRG_13258 [Saprolegnia parasitica CBS 223.65]KDO20560.1 hypothetical protein SPRG_13258 [Saprolegnia parasitica CBS 223.65]|eukprot:XP_012208749.1 hypothetical protein SPRG_13258 [Saprolegnia parasitica CBS 223.65]
MAASRTDELVALAITTNARGYRHLVSLYKAQYHVDELQAEDKACVTAAVRALRVQDAAADRAPAPAGVAVLTAYTTDYSIGAACAAINKQYADRHGYEFYCDELPYDEMMSAIAPRRFCGWYKVAMLRRLLANLDDLDARGIGYLFWIDADAVVIDQDKPASALIAAAGHRELILAEDMNPCCLVNTGVLLVRVCEWSQRVWDDVWAMRRYFDVFFYEQSALLRVLKQRDEGLLDVQPFHSFVKRGPSGLKLFPHVAVTPHLALNSNRCRGLTVHVSDPARRIDTNHSADEDPHAMAEYIFHCAGRCDKARTLEAVLAAHGLDTSSLGLSQLKLVRSKATSAVPKE